MTLGFYHIMLYCYYLLRNACALVLFPISEFCSRTLSGLWCHGFAQRWSDTAQSPHKLECCGRDNTRAVHAPVDGSLGHERSALVRFIFHSWTSRLQKNTLVESTGDEWLDCKMEQYTVEWATGTEHSEHSLNRSSQHANLHLQQAEYSLF
jgi:hypothetical protein